MRLQKGTVAKIAAAIIDGASPEEFARYAEHNLPYRTPNGTCLYVIGRDDKKLPVKEFTDLKYAPFLILTLPYDAANIKTIPLLWLIDIARGYSAFPMSGSEYNLNIIIVANIGKDSFTRKTKYGIIRFSSAKDLFDDIDKQVGNESKEHLEQVWAKYEWDGSTGIDARRLYNEYIKGALKARLTRSPNTYVSL
jgi:hypothetical protein